VLGGAAFYCLLSSTHLTQPLLFFPAPLSPSLLSAIMETNGVKTSAPDGVKRSSSYPMQTPDFTPHPHIPPDAHAAKEEPMFPRSIRALRDSADAKTHPRTIVICLDGTGDQFDNDNSNIVNFVSCLKKHTPGEQMTYYQSGIGTYDTGGLKNGVGAAMDMAVGSGLGKFSSEF
jgi:hypothetical protein